MDSLSRQAGSTNPTGELEQIRAEIAGWIEAGAQPWELPASAAHFVLACYGAESNPAGTFDALLAVSEECEDCGGDGYHQDDSHPGNPSFTCGTCNGHRRVPRHRDAGNRLAVMLRASFRENGYGSPEHEERCREALREWDAVALDEERK